MFIHTMRTHFAQDVPIAVMVSWPNDIDACLISGTGHMRRALGVCKARRASMRGGERLLP